MVTPILPLTIADAVIQKGSKTVLGPVSAKISTTGFTIVMGPNGAGKTSLLRMIHGLERLKGGKLDWQSDIATVRLRQSFVFQTPRVLRRSVVENLVYPQVIHGEKRETARKLAFDWLERINLAANANQAATELSVGERQKLAVSRALIMKPELLLLDEPSANLDGRATREIEELLNEANQKGTRIIMSTHSIGQAKRLASDVIFLHRGKIHECAPAEQFFRAPRTKEAKVFVAGGIVE